MAPYVNEKTSSDNIFNENYRYFFEIYALDDASNKHGIVYEYNLENVIKPIYKVLYEKARKHESFFEKSKEERDKILYKEAWKVAIDNSDTNGYVDSLYQLVNQKKKTNCKHPDETEYIKWI